MDKKKSKKGLDDRRTGSDRLSRVLRRSTIGAKGFNGRVRNGIGWDTFARAASSSIDQEAERKIDEDNLYVKIKPIRLLVSLS